MAGHEVGEFRYCCNNGECDGHEPDNTTKENNVDILTADMLAAMPIKERGKAIMEMCNFSLNWGKAINWDKTHPEYPAYVAYSEEYRKETNGFNANGAPRVTDKCGANPGSSFEVCGTVELTEKHTFHQMSQYPGADLMIECEPQTVEMRTNGYYVVYGFEGIKVGGGHYFKGDEKGEPAKYHAQPYSYSVDMALALGNSDNALIKYYAA